MNDTPSPSFLHVSGVFKILEEEADLLKASPGSRKPQQQEEASSAQPYIGVINTQS